MSNAAAGLAFTEPEHLVREFASRGIVVLPPERLGVAPGVHERIFRRKKELVDAGVRPTARNIPDILQVLSAPGLVAACNRLAGDNWAIVPFASGAGFASGAYDQHWHKDDNSPLNGRKQRHHQAVQVEMLYFPQAVGPAMGPTATIPYSQYWTFNHEDNHDNFAGADHLDFAYQIEQLQRVPVSGPDSPYDAEKIASRRTAHDVRMRKAVTDTGWPLARTMHDAAEPKRIGAAYQIASRGDTELAVRLLGEALYHDRESVRRAATYGLVAVGPAATDVFLQAVRSPVKWVRKAGVYGLGDASPLTEAVLQAVAVRLRDDPSVYVRSVAAGTLGCLVRRAVAAGQGVPLIPACVTALAESLAREPNRLAMDRAQGAQHQVHPPYRRLRRVRGRRVRSGARTVRARALRGAGERAVVPGNRRLARDGRDRQRAGTADGGAAGSGALRSEPVLCRFRHGRARSAHAHHAFRPGAGTGSAQPAR